MKRGFEAVLLIALTVLSLGGSQGQAMVLSASSSRHFGAAARTPIQHIVFVVQENQAFDHLFGTFPNLPKGDSEPMNICLPVNLTSPQPCVKPWYAGSMVNQVQGTDIPHTRTTALADYNKGKMNGFVAALYRNPCCHSIYNYTMSYVNGTIIPYYWDLAQYFTLNPMFMSSELSYSLPNHLYSVAAQAGNLAACKGVCQTEYNLTFAQIGEEMTQAGVTWAYYQQNWNDSIDCPSKPYTFDYINKYVHGYEGLWSGLTDFTQVQMDKSECGNLLNLNDLEKALRDNNLPEVSYVIPQPRNSDHPQYSTYEGGQLYVTSIINAIENSSAWKSTVIYLTWDDWGGYYDHIHPLQFDQYGEGFRVPLIAISPYSIRGAIVQAPAYHYGSKFTQARQEDFSSFLSTIEYNW
jgi:phospholipase C